MPSLLDNLTVSLADRYRITREIGAGGMATVYLAYDTRHDRKVALKVLKPELSAVVGAERFLAEIRTTANLQHPHILPLHDSGSVEGVVYYVMPYVDGESLRDRLDRERQLSVADAIRIATEVADALQYAHTHGVIHRDIKPENILLHEGHALVADFGIALAASNTAGGRITETGMSLGTPTYMSPEQAMGERNLDARTDVYALGCVLYEMLVGESPFTGATAQQIVARVMTEEPRSLTSQRKTVTPSVDAAVESALNKLPADRPASAAAFASMLRGDTAAPPHISAARTKTRHSFTLAALAVALLIVSVIAVKGWLRGTAAAPLTRTFVRFAPGEEPARASSSFILLTDGSALAYIGKSATGTQLWVKKRSELHARPLVGTENAVSVFSSPDSKWLGFNANGKLKKIPVDGGEVATLADASCFGIVCDGLFQGGGTWLTNGRIVFRMRDALGSVSESGGAVDTIVASKDVGGVTPLFPNTIPGSKNFVFTTCTLGCNKAAVWGYDVAARKPKMLRDFAAYGTVGPSGELLVADASGTIHALAFDAKSLTTSGAEHTVLEHVAGGISFGSDGTLAYLDGDPTPRSYVTVVDRSGKESPVDSGAWRGNFATLGLSPDGKRAAVSMVSGGGEEHLWIKSLGDNQQPMRLSVGAHAQYTTPAFSADGRTVFFTRFAGDSSSFMSRAADGSSPEVTVSRGKNWVIENVTSRDGRWRVTRGYRDGVRAMYAKRIDAAAGADTAERVVVQSSYATFSPALSPDGKWLLYSSEETGHVEIWAIPFPVANGARWQVSNEGGSEPSWSPDGKTIYYIDALEKLVAVDVSTSAGSFKAGAHHVLFDASAYKRHPTHRAYEVLPDGRFLMIHEGQGGAGDLVIVQNWVGK